MMSMSSPFGSRNTATNASANVQDQAARLATLIPTHNDLRDRAIREQANGENYRRQQQEALATSAELFGTSDLDELKKLRDQTQADESAKVDEFELAINAVVENLRKIPAAPSAER